MEYYLGRLANGDYVAFRELPDWDSDKNDWMLDVNHDENWAYVSKKLFGGFDAQLKPREIVRLTFEECEGRR